MTPEYYADQYRRYGLYARNYGDNKLYQIACGPRNDDYHWTEVLMERRGRRRCWAAAVHGRPGAALLHLGQAPARRLARWARPRSSTRPTGSRSSPRASSWRSSCAGTRRSWTSTIRTKKVRADRRRVGHLVRRRSRARIPASSTSRTRCATRSSPATHPRHLQQALRPRADGQHRPDRQRPAGA